MVAEKFQIYGLKIGDKYVSQFVSQIIESVHFCAFSQAKLSPRFLPLPPRQNSVFWRSIFPPAEKGGGRIMELKKLPKLNLQGYWTQDLINFTIFVTFKLLIAILLCHNLASSNKVFTKK